MALIKLFLLRNDNHFVIVSGFEVRSIHAQILILAFFTLVALLYLSFCKSKVSMNNCFMMLLRRVVIAIIKVALKP